MNAAFSAEERRTPALTTSSFLGMHRYYCDCKACCCFSSLLKRERSREKLFVLCLKINVVCSNFFSQTQNPGATVCRGLLFFFVVRFFSFSFSFLFVFFLHTHKENRHGLLSPQIFRAFSLKWETPTKLKSSRTKSAHC